MIASSVGKIYQQFAVTIIFAIAISTFNALVPMMAGLILVPEDQKAPLNGLLEWWISCRIFGMFTRANFGDLIVPIAIALFRLAGFFLNRCSEHLNLYGTLEKRLQYWYSA